MILKTFYNDAPISSCFAILISLMSTWSHLWWSFGLSIDDLKDCSWLSLESWFMLSSRKQSWVFLTSSKIVPDGQQVILYRKMVVGLWWLKDCSCLSFGVKIDTIILRTMYSFAYIILVSPYSSYRTLLQCFAVIWPKGIWWLKVLFLTLLWSQE